MAAQLEALVAEVVRSGERFEPVTDRGGRRRRRARTSAASHVVAQRLESDGILEREPAGGASTISASQFRRARTVEGLLC